MLNRAQYPSDVIALVVLWRLCYKLSLRDLPEMFLVRGMVFSYEAVREWETKLTPALAEELRRRRKDRIGRSWYVDETYLKVEGRWCYLYRAVDSSGALVDVMLSERWDMVARRAGPAVGRACCIGAAHAALPRRRAIRPPRPSRPAVPVPSRARLVGSGTPVAPGVAMNPCATSLLSK